MWCTRLCDDETLTKPTTHITLIDGFVEREFLRSRLHHSFKHGDRNRHKHTRIYLFCLTLSLFHLHTHSLTHSFTRLIFSFTRWYLSTYGFSHYIMQCWTTECGQLMRIVNCMFCSVPSLLLFFFCCMPLLPFISVGDVCKKKFQALKICWCFWVFAIGESLFLNQTI